MGKTFVYELPYPELEDPANIPNDIKELAEAVDDIIQISEIKELYYNDNPAYMSATLNDSILNYDLIIVMARSTDGTKCSTVLYKPQVNDQIALVAPQITSNTTIYNKQAVCKFTSETVIEMPQCHQLQGNTTIKSGQYMYLQSIIGIKLRPAIKDGDTDLSTGGSSGTLS